MRLTNLTMFYRVKNFRAFILIKRCSPVQISGLSRACIRIPGLSRPGKRILEIQGLSRISRTCTNPGQTTHQNEQKICNRNMNSIYKTDSFLMKNWFSIFFPNRLTLWKCIETVSINAESKTPWPKIEYQLKYQVTINIQI